MNDKLLKGGVPILDGDFSLKVSKDRLYAIVMPREEGCDLGNPEHVKEEILGQGITFGVVDQFTPGQGGACIVAKGQPASDGDNAVVKFHEKPSVVRAPKVKDPTVDRVDYRELGGIVNVEARALLIEKIPPTLGIAGKDVFGRNISPKPGKDLAIKLGPGVAASEDGLKFYSTVAGKFIMADGRPTVLEEHIINGDVDLSVGNVTFVGKSLRIDGEVLPGFRVKCHGDVSIAKGVNNAEIIAGGKVAIRGGIVGAEAHVQAQGCIEIDFGENGPLLETNDSLYVADVAIQTKVKAGKDVKAYSGRGILIGGEFVAGGSVYAKEIGSDAEVLTTICVGMKPEIEEKKKMLQQDQEIWPNKMTEVLKNIAALQKLKKESGNRLPPDKEKILEKLNGLLPKIMAQVDELTKREEEINKEMEKIGDESVYVAERLYPNVTVKIGKASRTTTIEEGNVVVSLEKRTQQIQIKGMSSDEKALFGELS